MISSDKLGELKGLLEKATAGPWRHYDEVFRRQFGKGRITEIQRRDGLPIVRWGGFDGLPGVTARKKNANAALIVAAINALPDLISTIEGLEGRLADQVKTSLEIGWKARAESAEAQRDALVEAMGQIKRLKPEPIGDSGFQTGPLALLQAAQRVARGAIAAARKGVPTDGQRMIASARSAIASLPTPTPDTDCGGEG